MITSCSIFGPRMLLCIKNKLPVLKIDIMTGDLLIWIPKKICWPIIKGVWKSLISDHKYAYNLAQQQQKGSCSCSDLEFKCIFDQLVIFQTLSIAPCCLKKFKTTRCTFGSWGRWSFLTFFRPNCYQVMLVNYLLYQNF